MVERHVWVYRFRYMRSRQTTFRPRFRALAAMTLCVWVGASVVCTAHCSLGLTLGHGDATRPSCHGSRSAQSHQDEGDSSSPGKKSAPSASCLTLKSALLNDHPATLT